jgi:2-oxoisovalerate dehydrogenase E1 component alpha subunit
MFRKLARTIARTGVPSAAAKAVPKSLFSSAAGEMAKFPGAKAAYTDKLEFAADVPAIPIYRVTDNDGQIILPEYKVTHSDAELQNMYKHMIRLNNMDKIFYDAQRQGRISFYMTAFGEEATHIGCASAFKPEDVILAQYREAGVLMWRGFSLNNFAHQCFGTHLDLGKGRQMPVHYGSRELNFHTISSPLGTQLPQATGVAYALKRAGKEAVAVCFFGEGAASEGDFHPALNFASTLDAPVLFFCRNNGYAISTPSSDQYRGDGIAGRAAGYGIKAIRFDGNDLLAVHDATKFARQYSLEHNRPVFLEAMSYRAGHHSTSDDATRYRPAEETAYWQTLNNPMVRTRKLLQQRGLWDEVRDAEEHNQARKDVLAALADAENTKKPAVSQLFEDVYAEMPHHLADQKAEWAAHIAKYGQSYPLGDFQPEELYVNPGRLVKD